MSLRCWWLHRAAWTTLIPGLLPFKLDGDHWCPYCSRGPGSRIRRFGLMPAGAAR